MCLTPTWPSSSKWSPAQMCLCFLCWLKGFPTRPSPVAWSLWTKQVQSAQMEPQSDHNIHTFYDFTPCLLCWLFIVIATESYHWLITPEMFRQTPGVWYITIGVNDSEWEPGLTLNISSFMTKCLYWHTEMEMWSADGCQACCDPRSCSYFVMFCCHQSVSVVSGGREKHAGAGTVSVQPPHPVRELFLCDAQWRGHIPHGRSVCHRVAELRGAGAAVFLFWPLPDHSAVGLLLRPQVTLEGQSECCIIRCGCAHTHSDQEVIKRQERKVCLLWTFTGHKSSIISVYIPSLH